MFQRTCETEARPKGRKAERPKGSRFPRLVNCRLQPGVSIGPTDDSTLCTYGFKRIEGEKKFIEDRIDGIGDREIRKKDLWHRRSILGGSRGSPFSRSTRSA